MLLIVVVTVCVNVYVDEFGLFGRDDVRIWGTQVERTTKYLHAYRYIPDNFEGIVAGSSVSDNMDTRALDGYKIYNLSMRGANATELRYAVEQAINRGNMKYLILCLYPLTTRDSGCKTSQIKPVEYWLSVFSMFPYQHVNKYKKRAIDKPYLDIFHSSEWGYSDDNMEKHGVVFAEVVETHKSKPYSTIVVDQTASSDLKRIVELAHKRDVQVLAYYYPIYHEWQQEYQATGAWEYYQSEINKLFSAEDLVWDMNTPEYYYITQDLSSYSDGHLSDRGAQLVLDDIERKLNSLKSGNTQSAGDLVKQ